ncbi:cytochrome P450 2A13-like isoform X3 [Podarcis raffonei]|uniref:cytochrome P450 2A13-like isoform X3 n=1 Tax=Podarcis raffonei TaxID=65483 RepID=UPI0023292A3E|nr:cytochrome P450 2A13-like isoform X3 [Podarcis raffonei]
MELLSGTLFLLLCVCGVLFLGLGWKSKDSKGRLPPGPTPLPILGNFLQLDPNNMIKSLEKLREAYGSVFTVYLGLQRVVVLCGYKAVKEALVDQAEDFSGRGQLPSFSKDFNEHGVVFSNGDRWRQLRRFSLTTLRNFGMGKRSIEERIQEEAQCLAEEFHKTQGTPFDPTFILSRAVSNIICSIVFGNRFQYDDEKFLTLNNLITERFRVGSLPPSQLYDMFSGVMQYLPGPQHEAFKQLLGLEKFITRKAKAQEETLDPNAPRDFIDCFLVKMQQEKENTNTEFFLKNLVMTTLTIFFAGTESISTTLRYGFLLLLKYPEVEEKVHKEIERVIGSSRTPNMDDRPLMPYTDAVIHEIQRFTNMFPSGVARCVTRDTQFRGYTIPKGTEVFPMLGSVLRDAQHFARPDVFDPQHFLDEKGQFKKNEAFMPFSVGKRYCLGEQLARKELFLIFTSILQNFRFKSPIPSEQIDISPMLVGFVTIPRSYDMCAIPL